MNDGGMSGMVFYFLYDMIIKAGLFILIGIIIAVTGTSNLRNMGGLMKTHASLGWMYLIAAFGLIGIPPLSGFIGKLLIVQGGFEAGNTWATIIILASSVIVILSAMRIFIYAFWGEPVAIPKSDRRSYSKGRVPTISPVVSYIS